MKTQIMTHQLLKETYNPENRDIHLRMQDIENGLYSLANQMSVDYKGGQWTVITVDGKNYFCPPEGNYNVVVRSNFFSGVMGNITFGAALTVQMANVVNEWLTGHNTLEEVHVQRYYSLRNTVLDNPELFDVEKFLNYLD